MRILLFRKISSVLIICLGLLTLSYQTTCASTSSASEAIIENYSIVDSFDTLPPQINTNPTSLVFSLKPGDTDYSQTIKVWNSGSGEINYFIIKDSDWLSCIPASGSSKGEENIITVYYEAIGLTEGVYTATISLSDPGAVNSPLDIPVTMVIGDRSPVYRFWSDQNLSHFYTINGDEQYYITTDYPEYVWKYEIIAWYAYTTIDDAPIDSSPVYRFWSDLGFSHFYTISEEEKDFIITNYPEFVWKYEGIAYYAYAPGDELENTMPVYRFWSETLQTHFYTISEEEKDAIIATYPEDVWTYEGIAWHAFDSPSSD